MSKYIDADKAIKDYARYGIKHFYDATDLEAILNECPAADVAEVRHGRWIVLGEQIENQTFDECKCSECGCVEYFNKGWKHFNYCPNCGADMRSKQNV